eukprot:NODE_5886_length_629_cov_14.772414_g5489_i0.p1 GENE.NODE_5886_length_629_cov_14.772414_g5489_i0~~NODE_5886_length_629_cov_14.772414_g5489_i0.p1  ORF type:complete len:101 (-),score=21.27 NODE_5886_length_629_cov_14.772414_g5489_i0:172-474(-)
MAEALEHIAEGKPTEAEQRRMKRCKKCKAKEKELKELNQNPAGRRARVRYSGDSRVYEGTLDVCFYVLTAQVSIVWDKPEEGENPAVKLDGDKEVVFLEL